jgi:uncharacterized protein involved in oxidation of intracellular sulfur
MAAEGPHPMSNKMLVILNDPPYGTERSYNGLRLAGSLVKRGEELRLFLMGDAASCAKRGQILPRGYYNIESMLKVVSGRGGRVGACGSCMDARGIPDAELVDGCQRSTLDELTDWVQWADRILVF